MEYTAYQLPDQNIPDSKKTKKWHIQHANTMVDFINSEFYDQRIATIREAEGLYNVNNVEKNNSTSFFLKNIFVF